MQGRAEKKNRVLRVAVVLSLIFHLVIFMQISGEYRSRPLSCIELTMKDAGKPFVRSIPRPRIRTREPRSREVAERVVREKRVPQLKAIHHAPGIDSPLLESVAVPATDNLGVIPEGIVSSAAPWAPAEPVSDFASPMDYFDMMRLKIEGNKRYPESGKKRQQEGRVRVRLVIDREGRLSSLKIVKGSRHKVLDRAALNAVRNSAPFPRPPASLLKEPLKLELTINFQLT